MKRSYPISYANAEWLSWIEINRAVKKELKTKCFVAFRSIMSRIQIRLEQTMSV